MSRAQRTKQYSINTEKEWSKYYWNFILENEINIKKDYVLIELNLSNY